MSLTTPIPENQRDVALLQDLLHKREYHLAELIDEVVVAEQERFKAVEEAHSVRELATHLESAFNKLLEYHITMHKEVLLPALVASVKVDGASTQRTSASRQLNGEMNGKENHDDGNGADKATPSNDFLNDLLTEPQLSRETKRLLQAVMQQRRDRGALTPTRQEAAPLASSSALYDKYGDGPSDDAGGVVQRATRRAIVLSDSLLQNQETLTRLLRNIQNQAEEMLDHWSKKGSLPDGNSTASPAVTLGGVDPHIVRSPSPRSAAAASFRLENLHQHSDRARAIEEELRKVEEERDTLQKQLLKRQSVSDAKASNAALPSEKEAWDKERVHLKQELAYAQQRALEEQSRCRKLKKQVAHLEQIAAASPIPPPSPPVKAATCKHCQKVQAEMKKTAADYRAAEAAWEAEKDGLNREIWSLQCRVEAAEAGAGMATAQATAAGTEGGLAPPPPFSPPSTSSNGATAQAPRYPAGPSSEREIGKLEAKVAAMKADLQIMETRMSIVQSEREAERQRILAAHEQERDRLRSERDQCQKIIDKMSRELKLLSRSNAQMPAITSSWF
ncbi:hypothetical protein ABL78_0182 [Leptomonas seymouri]|uniref:Uncharacterized protein n=1 Tax=Leptomonas seymouri TaxID=5684 RepID=A0A0N0P962_LEPSE|nr:hypothetical protein ABL78_0182 [Leptomonas seymouri]|eukprot:KPI90746.1 hypothetical protein ABL78_0182 [Leptomonas seymouri]